MQGNCLFTYVLVNERNTLSFQTLGKELKKCTLLTLRQTKEEMTCLNRDHFLLYFLVTFCMNICIHFLTGSCKIEQIAHQL